MIPCTCGIGPDLSKSSRETPSNSARTTASSSSAFRVATVASMLATTGSLDVTFHRAFDISHEPESALEDIIALRCERVLTSGAQADALAGAALIGKLVAQAAGRISVMPGAGVNARNVVALRAQTGAREFHASAKRELPSRMRGGNDLPGMTAGEVLSDVEQVRALVAALNRVAGS